MVSRIYLFVKKMLAIYLLFFTFPSYAEDAPLSSQDKNTLESIVVTAQKTEQDAQDVGITMSTLSEQGIHELGFIYPTDISNQIPNVQVVKTVLPFFSIRGMGLNEFAPNSDSPVAVHLDEVYLSKAFQVTGALFDMERIEVLKGPQGTLFGRNTTGGSINFTTKKPTFEPEGGLTLGYSRFDRKEAEAYISGPIINDYLLGRLSGFTRQSSEGPTYNAYTDEDLGKLDQFGLRGQLLWFPNDDNEILFSIHGGEDNSEIIPYGIRGTYDASVFPGTVSL